METKVLKALVFPLRYFYIGLIPNLICALILLFNPLSIFNLFCAGLNFLVGFSKYMEYSRCRERLKTGWGEGKVKSKMYSWCQRHAAKQAARECGYAKEFEEFARREGHRWWHLLPKLHRIHELDP